MALNSKQQKTINKLEKKLDIKFESSQRRTNLWYAEFEGSVVELRLNDLQLEQIPEEIYQFDKLAKLSLRSNFLETLGDLNSLKLLSVLDLSDNQISDISGIEKLENLKSLFIHGNQIVDISDLSSMQNLIELDMSNNSIIHLSALEQLSALRELFISGNNLTLLNGIQNLINLEVLNAGFNTIDDIEPLSALTKLRKLSIQYNEITDISPIANLQHLADLDLTYNIIENLDVVAHCSGLKSLNLSFSKLTDIKTVAVLKNISILVLDGLDLADLSALRSLPVLKRLYMRQTPILDSESLSKCTSLTWLDLNKCNLENISFLSSLKSLTNLNLRENNIKNIGAIKDLPNLVSVDLSQNQISIFPDWLTETKMELSFRPYHADGYNITSNPIENVPPIFLKQNNGSIRDYLKSLKKGATPINEIKVIILGEGAAGKTSLVNYLKGEEFNEFESQTHGINIAECLEETGVNMKIWDFGGQDIMHHTHQLFLTENSIYILLLNAREKSDTEKWLKLIKVFGGDSPVIIMTNKIDENPSEHENIKFLDTKYDNIQGRYVRISCKTGEGLEEVNRLLTSTIGKMLHARTLWGNSWLAVKQDLERMRQGSQLKDYISYEKYEELCNNHDVLPSHRDTLIGWLNELGVVTYFKDSSLNETNVINPSWLTEAFYSIINSHEVATNFGKFKTTDLSEILEKGKYPKHKYNFLTSLMTKFELCYQIDKENYLIPDLLKREEPNSVYTGSNGLNLKFKYSTLLPKAILPKFMVRRHHEIYNDQKWRSGVVIKDRSFGATAVIRQDEDEKEISINVTGEDKRGYLASVRSTLNSINSIYESLEFEELVPCQCKDCSRSKKKHFFKYSLLKRLKENGTTTYPCENSLKKIQVNELLGIMLTKEDLENEIKKIIGSGAFSVKTYLENGAIESFIDTVEQLFSSISYLLFEKDEKAYHTPLFLVLRSIFGNLAKADEIQASGRCDITLNLNDYVYVLELKLDGTAQMAMDQIYEKKYFLPYKLEHKPIELIGINFSSKTRNVDGYLYERLA